MQSGAIIAIFGGPVRALSGNHYLELPQIKDSVMPSRRDQSHERVPATASWNAEITTFRSRHSKSLYLAKPSGPLSMQMKQPQNILRRESLKMSTSVGEDNSR